MFKVFLDQLPNLGSISPKRRTLSPMTNHLQESRMREICTSGLTRGSTGIGLYRRPVFSTLLFLSEVGGVSATLGLSADRSGFEKTF